MNNSGQTNNDGQNPNPSQSIIEEIIGYNGPAEAGIAAGAEKGKEPRSALVVGSGASTAARSGLDICRHYGLSDPKAIGIVVCGAVLVEDRHWHGANSNVVGGGPNLNCSEDDALKALREAGGHEALAQSAATAIAATKINWFLTNHHVGQGTLTGFAKKVSHVLVSGSVANSTAWYNCLWAMGHWADTRHVLAGLGVKNVVSLLNVKAFPKGSSDIALRVASCPAGSAKVGVVYEVAKRARASAYAAAIPVPPGLTDFVKKAEEIPNNPPVYHIGAATLGHERKEVEVSEELLIFASAYVHAVIPKSTLAASKSLLPIDSVKDERLYVSLRSLAVAIATSMVPTEEAVKKIMDSQSLGKTLAELPEDLIFRSNEDQE